MRSPGPVAFEHMDPKYRAKRVGKGTRLNSMASGRAVGREETGCLLHAGYTGVLTVLGCLSLFAPLKVPSRVVGRKGSGHFQETSLDCIPCRDGFAFNLPFSTQGAFASPPPPRAGHQGASPVSKPSAGASR